MGRILSYLFVGLVASLFFFPFNLPFADGVNTKMILAAIGLALFFLDKTTQRSSFVSKDFLIFCLIAAFISIWALSSTTINKTHDYSFASYIISVIVWLAGAYTVVWLIRAVHGSISIELIGSYLAAVCVGQCLLAYFMTLSPELKSFIDGLMGDSERFMGKVEGRLYGLGAALDPTGLRFSAALIILAHLISHTDYSKKARGGLLYMLSFMIITVIGNMIARTTLVGALLAILYFLLMPLWGQKLTNAGAFWAFTLPILLMGILLCIWLYDVSPKFRSDIRFGFEGFFSLAEKGRWEVHSNEVLKRMIVWPEALKTWVVGDGFFDNPDDIPNRLGKVKEGFYMMTDVGYLRYIFYFGTIGLIGMIAIFVQMTVTCCRKFQGYVPLFIFLLLVNLIGWLKVSSDIIMIFAPFLILAYIQDEEAKAQI